MPQTTHSGLPAEIVAGDSTLFTDSNPDDVSEVSTATYHFANDSGERFKAVGTAGASNYSYAIQGGDTAKLTGTFTARLVVEYTWGRETQTDRGGTIKITPNPEAEHEKTFNEEMVAILQGYLKGDDCFLTGYTVAGLPIEKMDHEAANRLLKDFEAKVRDEKAQRRVDSGRGSGRRIKLVFEKS